MKKFFEVNVEAEEKLTDLAKKVAQISEKRHDYFSGRMYFTYND